MYVKAHTADQYDLQACFGTLLGSSEYHLHTLSRDNRAQVWLDFTPEHIKSILSQFSSHCVIYSLRFTSPGCPSSPEIRKLTPRFRESESSWCWHKRRVVIMTSDETDVFKPASTKMEFGRNIRHVEECAPLVGRFARYVQTQKTKVIFSNSITTTVMRETWVFYGCSHLCWSRRKRLNQKLSISCQISKWGCLYRLKCSCTHLWVKLDVTSNVINI